MTKSQKIRLQFIDAMFTVHGRCPAAQIIDVFGVATACASRDLRTYGQMNNQVVFSHQHLSYMCRFNFEPVDRLLGSDPVDFLESVSVVFGVPNLAREGNIRPLPRGTRHE